MNNMNNTDNMDNENLTKSQQYLIKTSVFKRNTFDLSLQSKRFMNFLIQRIGEGLIVSADQKIVLTSASVTKSLHITNGTHNMVIRRVLKELSTPTELLAYVDTKGVTHHNRTLAFIDYYTFNPKSGTIALQINEEAFNGVVNLVNADRTVMGWASASMQLSSVHGVFIYEFIKPCQTNLSCNTVTISFAELCTILNREFSSSQLKNVLIQSVNQMRDRLGESNMVFASLSCSFDTEAREVTFQFPDKILQGTQGTRAKKVIKALKVLETTEVKKVKKVKKVKNTEKVKSTEKVKMAEKVKVVPKTVAKTVAKVHKSKPEVIKELREITTDVSKVVTGNTTVVTTVVTTVIFSNRLQ